MSTCTLEYEACVQRSHPCFGHKMRYAREGGGLTVRRPSELFRSGTIKEHQTAIIENGRAQGYDPQPVGSRWV